MSDEPSIRVQLDEIADDVACGAAGPSDLVAKAMELLDERDAEIERYRAALAEIKVRAIHRGVISLAHTALYGAPKTT